MAADVVGATAYRDAPPDSGVMERPKQAPKRCAECKLNASRREMIARRFGVGVAKRKFGKTVKRIERWPADEVGGVCRLNALRSSLRSLSAAIAGRNVSWTCHPEKKMEAGQQTPLGPETVRSTSAARRAGRGRDRKYADVSKRIETGCAAPRG